MIEFYSWFQSCFIPQTPPEFIIFLAFNANNVWIEKISNLKATHAHECAGNMAQNFVPKATHSARIQTKHKITIGKIWYRMDIQFQARYIECSKKIHLWFASSLLILSSFGKDIRFTLWPENTTILLLVPVILWQCYQTRIFSTIIIEYLVLNLDTWLLKLKCLEGPGRFKSPL